MLPMLPAHAQDAAAGERSFVVCRACHQLGPSARNGVGPQLNGVVGRAAGTVAGYAYSDANRTSGITWDGTTLDKYLAAPQAVVPGTKMTFPGLKDPERRRNIVAYLATFRDDGTRTEGGPH